MAGKSNNNATLFAQKKLLNKAHTSVLKSDAQETITSNIQPAAQTTFGQSIPSQPEKTLYLIQSASAGKPGTVEYVEFDVTSISGTSYDGNAVDTGAGPEPSSVGPHGYALSLPSNYESLSSNSKAGQGVFDDGKVLSGTLGQLQIIPPVFSTDRPNPYSVTLYKGSTSDPTSVIPLESEIDYQLDTFNGILFVQDYDPSNEPVFARAFIYVGDMVDTVIENSIGGGGGGSGDGNAEYLVLAATGSLNNERVFNPTDGLISQDAGAGNNYTLQIDNSVVATLTGSEFTGPVGFQGPVEFQGAITGSFPVDRKKGVYFLTSPLSAGTSFPAVATNFADAKYEQDKIDVFVNGMLLHSGTAAQVTASERDYYIDSASSLKFSFDMKVDDVIDVVVFKVT